MKTVQYALGVVSRFCYGERFKRERQSTVQRTRFRSVQNGSPVRATSSSANRQNCFDERDEATGFVVVADGHEVVRLEQNEDASLNFVKAEAISSLLDDESVLRNILGALVDDGLQDCRLVCRKWRNVCDTLPVKLAILSCDDMQQVPNTFPQTSTLSLHTYSNRRRIDDTCLGRDRPTDSWTDSLTKLAGLRNLTIKVMYVSDQLSDGTGCSFLPLVQLQSLAITAIGDLNAEHLFLGLRQLTNLTSLQLISKSVWKRPSSAEPVVEIQKLKELELSENLFSNSVGQLMFPCLAQLTHLGFADRPRLLSEVCELCGTSLQSLRIGSCEDYGSAVVDWPVLLQFSKLESLALDNATNRTGAVESIVGDMTFLTSLRVNEASYGEARTTNMLASLSGLRSLCYLPRDGLTASTADAHALHVSHLTQLTGLTTILCSEPAFFSNLTSLMELDVVISAKLDLSEVLSRLTLLKALKVVNRQHSCLDTPSVLRNLRDLKSITLEMPNDIGGDFFPALASLPALTFLQFNCRNHEVSVPFLPEVSQVTNLKKLSVEHVVMAHPLRFLKRGSLPRLRSLRIQPFPDLKETREELRRRFPCLSRITP